MSYHVACKNSKNKSVHHEVPEDVYKYIRQLEHKIEYPTLSKLEELYPQFDLNRFSWAEVHDGFFFRINDDCSFTVSLGDAVTLVKLVDQMREHMELMADAAERHG